MAQQNTERISHTLEKAPNVFRDDQLEQVINDITEEETGKGFSEVVRTGVFVDKIIVWQDLSKTKKRTETTFNRTGVFVDQIVKEFFDEETGLVKIATTTANITRIGSFVSEVEVLNTRL